MPKRLSIFLGVAIVLIGIIVTAFWYLSHHTIAVFAPQGTIAFQQRKLIFVAFLMSIIVVVPVFIMLGIILWKYRDHKKATYRPDFTHSRLVETIWWGVPTILILILSVITWRSSHDLDPFKPLNSPTKPITIQVVALQWKWLFIYPDQGIATINYVQFPEKTPVNFQITADAPMNSFWIPQLGGQVYAMSGMSTKLHLIADKPGVYKGSSANISGEGFSGMTFSAESRTAADFTTWVKQTKQAANPLTYATYDELVKPSKNVPVTLYSSSDQGLYDTIVEKFMAPKHHTTPAGKIQ